MAATRRPTLALVAPSGVLPEGLADRAAQYFAGRGWRVQAGESCFARETRFAGPDELRLQDLQRFASDRRIDLVLCARGGYGLSRLLDRLDFAAIARSGAVIVGLSDFTAFNLAYLARAGGISFQGPAAADFAAETPEPYTVEQFFAALGNAEHRVEFDGDGPDCAVGGRIWGGNLALLSALVGTPYLPRVRGGILFLEDVNEPAYRVERMLYQLLHAGVLARCRAVLLGDFSPMPAQPTDNGFDLAQVVNHFRARIDVPVLTGLPFGHVRRKLTLPVGARARLRARGGRIELAFTGHPTLRAGCCV
jgi:muramoyltetrapeptide carboxypeptidase